MTLQSIHYDSTHLDTYNLVGFSGCLHLWWISLLTPELLTPSYVLQVLRWINFPSPQG